MLESGKLLLSWLRLLGWIVIVEETERGWLGVGRHETSSGDILEVNASGGTYADVVWQLFNGALSTLERQRTAQAA